MIKTKYNIIFPDLGAATEQDEEFFYLEYADRKDRFLCHDYSRIFDLPGLYEEVFYHKLKCQSPVVVAESLVENAVSPEGLRVLDFGAGNGMVGEELTKRGCDSIVGVDILPGAKKAASRDRPGIYKDFHIMDLCSLKNDEKDILKAYNFNALVTVAALGFGDIPPGAFISAFNLIEKGGYIAFNIKDKFLSHRDNTGYSDIIPDMCKGCMNILFTRTYTHRYSISGEKLDYRVIVAGKKDDFRFTPPRN